MKRFLWLACISCCCSLAVVACGDDDTGNNGDGGTEGDGGVSPGGGGKSGGNSGSGSTNIDSVKKDVTDLKSDLDDANSMIEDANSAIDDLDKQAADIKKRLDDLGVPGNCSVNEACIPDGVSVAQMGIATLVEQLCTLEINCCDDNELNYKFGPGITDVKSCTNTFTDLVNNGFSPSFLSENGYLVSRVISIAQAINSNDVQVSIDPKAVAACVASLKKRECNKYVDPGEPEEITNCEPVDYTPETTPCDLSLLVVGEQKEGDVCGITGVNECAPGLVCRPAGGLFKICATPSSVGDACRSDADCDGTEQFCNLDSGKCAERGDEGDDCAYVDPSFSYGLSPTLVGGGWQNPSAIKIECKRGLLCDPSTNTCVSNCSTGAICGSDFQCPEGEICNYTMFPRLKQTNGLGVCSEPIAQDEPCACLNGSLGGGCAAEVNTQCETNRCGLDVIDDRNECIDALKAVGATCTLTAAGIAQPDATCITGVCGGDAKCAKLCVNDAECGNGFYCDASNALGQSRTIGISECEPKKAADDLCNPAAGRISGLNNIECLSGYCDASLSLCKPKLALAASCPIGRPADACNGSYCHYDSGGGTYTCTAFIAAGSTCAYEPGGSECGAGAVCGSSGTNAQKCVAYVAAAGTCDPANNVLCDPTGNLLACVITDSAGPTRECIPVGMLPEGAACTFNEQCLSTWCRGSDGTCEPPLAEGEDCDINDSAINVCADGSYCKYPDLPTTDPAFGEGVCTATGTAGVECDPRYHGGDCISGCDLRNDTFLCNSSSLEEETLFCDGD